MMSPPASEPAGFVFLAHTYPDVPGRKRVSLAAVVAPLFPPVMAGLAPVMTRIAAVMAAFVAKLVAVMGP